MEDKFSYKDFLHSLGIEAVITDDNKIKTYTNLEDELRSLSDGVGLRNISHYGMIELRGKDVLDFLHRISTNSVRDLAKEKITKTIFTTEKGRIIDLTVLMNFEDYQILFCHPEHHPKIFKWLTKYIINDDVKISDINGKYSLLEIIGPQADSFVTLVCGTIVNNIPENSFKVISAEGMLFFLAKMRDIKNNIKYWVIADHVNSSRFVKYSVEHKEIFDFNLVGEEAYNIYRVEQGILTAPNEINDNYNPNEAGLRDYIDFNKGCYIGQEVIARLDTYDKVQRGIKGFVFEGPAEQKEYSLYNGDQNESGKVTSVVYSPKCGKNIGLGYLKKSYLTDGSVLTAKDPDGNEIKVSVHKIPFRK
ncbi:MAG TPA: glycine cleavage T C-terminal barrel domain-containing protein [Ignavibacteriaceae bacterium]|nr:glycine cleavage T C-terminal barrel domain-containing protein [Ignavibacteriaceae bacterium]